MATNKHSTQLIFDAIIKDGGFQTSITRMTKSTDMLEKAVGRFKNTLLGAFSAYAVLGAIQNAVRTIAEFDKAMVAVKVITGATASEFNRLEKSARILGSTTQFTAKEIAELQLEFGRLGFSTKEILQATSATVDLATATGEGLARSAEIAGSTMRAFNLDASEMGRVTNAIGNALNYSALTLDSFADGIKYVAPVAAAMNVSIEETASMLSVLADAGIKGSQAGTSLRRIFTLLTNDGKPLNERLDELAKTGITLAAANDEVGLYAQTALLVLAKYKPRVDELTKAFIENQDAIDNMARAMEDNLATTLTKVKTAYDALILSIDQGKGVIGAGADHLSNLLTVMSMSDEDQSRLGIGNIEAMLGGIAALAPSVAKHYADLLRNLRKEELKSLEESAKVGEDWVNKTAENLFRIYGSDVSAAAASIKKDIAGIFPDTMSSQRAADATKAYLTLVKELLAAQMKASGVTKTLSEEEQKALEKKIDTYKKLIESSTSYYQSIQDGITAQVSSGTGAFATDITSSINPSGASGELGLTMPDPEEYDSLFQQYGETWDQFTERILGNIDKQVQAWDFWGDTIAGVLDNVIAKDESFAKSAAETTARIIDGARKEIAVYIAKAAAKALSLNPTPGGIATASAIIGIGLSLVSGVLKKFAKASDTNTRVSSRTYSGSSGGMTASTVIRGQDLYVVMNNYNKAKGFTGG